MRRHVDIAGCILMLAWAALLADAAMRPLHAQDLPRDSSGTLRPRLGIPASGQEAPLGRDAPITPHEQRIFLPAFRAYIFDRELEGQRIAVRNMIMVNLRMETLGADYQRRVNEEALIRSNFGIVLPRSAFRKSSVWEALGTLFLEMAAQYAVSYATESLIGRLNDEIDYLHLPRPPGVIRTSFEAREDALMRGELQAMEVWYDYYWSLKNRVRQNTQQAR